MQIKQFTSFSLTFKEHFIEFCERSKPMDFCQISSRKLRRERRLKWIQKYDKMCKLKKVNGQLIATWNRNDWSN